MIGIVKVALRRPYTFIVVVLLILIFGISAALRTPIDIFPNINIPVVAVVFSYTRLSPAELAGRIVTYCERGLTTSVNHIEHIESQSIPNYGAALVIDSPPEALQNGDQIQLTANPGTAVAATSSSTKAD